MWDLRGPGIKLVSPALAGGFFTTELHQGSPGPKLLTHGEVLKGGLLILPLTQQSLIV